VPFYHTHTHTHTRNIRIRGLLWRVDSYSNAQDVSCLSETLHLLQYPYVSRSRNSLVSTVSTVGARMPVAAKDLSLLQNVYTRFEVPPQPHIQYIPGVFPSDKVPVACS